MDWGTVVDERMDWVRGCQCSDCGKGVRSVTVMSGVGQWMNELIGFVSVMSGFAAVITYMFLAKVHSLCYSKCNS